MEARRPATGRTPDVEPFDELFRRVRPQLERFLAANGLGIPDCEDLVQQVFVDLVAKRSSVRKPEAWLLGAIRRALAGYWRSRLSHERVVLGFSEQVEDPPTRHDQGLHCDLRRVLALLNPRDRRILLMVDWIGFSVAEMAAGEGCSPAAISSTLWRARRELRRIFAKR